MMPHLTLPTTPTRDLERVVSDAHALATALYAEASFALGYGFEAEAQRVYGWGEQAFALGLRTELALEHLREGRAAMRTQLDGCIVLVGRAIAVLLGVGAGGLYVLAYWALGGGVR